MPLQYAEKINAARSGMARAAAARVDGGDPCSGLYWRVRFETPPEWRKRAVFWTTTLLGNFNI
jgi:hypothetical protein